MNTFLKRVFLLNILLILISCASPGGNENTTVLMKTSMGDIRLKLYDETPLHRDNFIKLVESGFYDGISFHRVIQDFMIQAGDPETRTSKEGLNDSLSTYTIPAEFRQQYFHKKGALAAAREGNDVNPEMRSSGTQFYIVQGTKLTDDEIKQMEQRVSSNMKQSVYNRFLKEVADSSEKSGKPLTPGEIQEIASMKMFNFLNANKDFEVPANHREVYKTLGGVPRLDGTYTVFGEVTEGLDVVDKIAAVQTDSSDKPVNDIKILKARIVK
ncbi:MAG TPA: peptidylprolyl isomerase [Bacteroidales bacterium]|nr:peptidylprolyl isomerase [Bacteroidales bacterium]